MNISEFLNILRKRIFLMVLLTSFLTLTTGVISFFIIKPTYKADISVFIGNSNKSVGTDTQNYNDILMYQNMVKTYSKLATTRAVADDVIEKLNLLPMNASELLSNTTVTADDNTQFLTVSVHSKNSEKAMNIANQFAKSLKDISIKVNKVDLVEIIDNAQLPTAPDSPKPVRNTALALFIGIMFSIGFSIILEYLDNTIKTEEDVEKLSGLSVIGTISFINTKDEKVIIL